MWWSWHAEQIQQLKNYKPTIAVGTPGRVIDHLSKKRMRVDTLRSFIIDEVDEMLNFGFKEDMDQIVSFLPKDRRTIILSATLPKFVMKVAKQYLGKYEMINAMAGESEKPNIHEQYYRIKN